MSRLRVLSYNVHAWVDRDGRFDPERVLAVVESARADVVCLQEVVLDPENDEPHHAPTLGEVSERLNMLAVPGPTLERKGAPYGNLLLSRFHVLGRRLVDISHPGREPRGIIDVDLETPGGVLRVMTTHLGLSPVERTAQVRWLMEQVKAESWPLVLCGDFNEWIPGRPGRMKRHFGSTPAPKTFPARLPMLALDRVWCRPRAILRNLEVMGGFEASRASDHRPLLADIDFARLPAISPKAPLSP
ncbi:endonuclease/exonuclease/phosphatase family protein [Desulfohalovibrio reitneri]|uniref:endonuclease/exonuclease/phosphatase family protein n=1 Tax=Desulfohalovibrio reitneri TaxID=1307759 RepID=UPI000691FA41|nr:endonuclease/exonuclease/phosphatase family protein [Desulfohalovibrio reitneri]